MTGPRAIGGRMGAVSGGACALLGNDSWLVVGRVGITAPSHPVSHGCCTIGFGGDFITVGGTLIIPGGDTVPLGEIVELLASHGPHGTQGRDSTRAIFWPWQA
jgi:hypothetical protein